MAKTKSLLDIISEHTENLKKNNPAFRDGQAFFNACSDISSDIAKSIRGTVVDPYYNDGNIQKCKDLIKSIVDESAHLEKKDYTYVPMKQWEKNLAGLVKLEEDVEHLQEKLEDVHMEKDDAIQYRAVLLEQLIKVQGELNHIKQVHTNEKATLERRVASLLGDLDVTKTNNTNFLAHIKQYDVAFKEAKSVIDAANEKIKKMETQIALNEHMAKKLVQKEQEVRQLQEKNNCLTADIDKFACPYHRFDKSAVYIACGKCVSCKLEASYQIIRQDDITIKQLDIDVNMLKNKNKLTIKKNDEYKTALSAIAYGYMWPWTRKNRAVKALTEE